MLCLSTFFTGCVSSQKPDPLMSGLLLAEAEPISPRIQISIAQYNEWLYRAELSSKERSELLFQRGVAYDAIGLSSLARRDYAESIKLNPAFAAAHNSVGVHYIQAGMFMLAYESFDASLDINPKYSNAILNRGIALYYGGRSELAVQDTQQFLNEDKSDPIRAIWHYITKRSNNAELAIVELADNREFIDSNDWTSSIIDFYLGEVPESKVIASLLADVKSQTQLNHRLCEAYFYLGKFYAWQGHRGKAENYFKLSLSTNVYEYIEHKYSRIELANLRQVQPVDAPK